MRMIMRDELCIGQCLARHEPSDGAGMAKRRHCSAPVQNLQSTSLSSGQLHSQGTQQLPISTAVQSLHVPEGRGSMSDDEPVSELAVKTAIQNRADYMVANLAYVPPHRCAPLVGT